MCKAELSIGNQFSEAPWFGALSSVNDSALDGAKDSNSQVLTSCTFKEFEHFHSFYLKFMTTVREFFLPPERHRFGLVSERSILSSLGVGDSGSWFAVHYLAGCLGCLKILKAENDLKRVLQMDNYFVTEVNIIFLTVTSCLYSQFKCLSRFYIFYRIWFQSLLWLCFMDCSILCYISF